MNARDRRRVVDRPDERGDLHRVDLIQQRGPWLRELGQRAERDTGRDRLVDVTS